MSSIFSKERGGKGGQVIFRWDGFQFNSLNSTNTLTAFRHNAITEDDIYDAPPATTRQNASDEEDDDI